MKKNTKKPSIQGAAPKPERRVVILRELEDDDLSSATGGGYSPPNQPGGRPWIWG